MNNWKRILLCTLALISTKTYAGGFLLWEQNGAGLGDYHAGSAVDAEDASTEYYNPAGLPYIKHTQAVAGVVMIPTDIEFNGTVQVSSVNPPPELPQNISEAQGGGINFIPNLHFAQPINSKLTWAFGIDVPYGLKTDYSASTYIRYAGTETLLETVDFSPSLGYQLTKDFSVGAGFDAVHAHAKFDQYAGGPTPILDTTSDNDLNSWGFGYHLGVLYQWTPKARVGLAYRSKVVEDLTGKSTFTGYLANGNFGNGIDAIGNQISNNLKSTITLPPTTTLSGLYDATDKVRLLASTTYTQWSYIKALLLQNVASVDTETWQAINNAEVYIQQDFRNTWNFSVGTEYKVDSTVKLRAGAGYDQTPVRNSTLRYIQTPDADRYALAIGGQFTPNKKIAIDIGWTHLFILKAPINSSAILGTNPNTPNTPGGETVTVQGDVDSTADVFGFQVAWNFD